MEGLGKALQLNGFLKVEVISFLLKWLNFFVIYENGHGLEGRLAVIQIRFFTLMKIYCLGPIAQFSDFKGRILSTDW